MARAINKKSRYGVVAKWGEEVAGRGFAQVPNYLIYLNQFIDDEYILSPTEMLILIQLISVWWELNERPYPSIATLAKRCGVSDRQIQRAISSLEKKGLLKRVKRRSSGIIASNAYDLSPLVETLKKAASAFPNAFPRKVDPIDSEDLDDDIPRKNDKDGEFEDILGK